MGFTLGASIAYGATNSAVFPLCSFKAYTSEVFSQKLDLLIARLAATAAASTGTCSSKAGSSPPAAASPAEVDLHDLMYRFTLDTFSRIGFGVDPGCLTTPGKIPFAQAFDRAQVVRQGPSGRGRVPQPQCGAGGHAFMSLSLSTKNGRDFTKIKKLGEIYTLSKGSQMQTRSGGLCSHEL
jgi:hypothetical protein